VKKADAQIAVLSNTLKDMKIKAPVSGIIDQKNFNLNEISGKGAVIFHIVELDKVYVEVNVPESYISYVKQDMPVSIMLDSLNDQAFAGSVDRIIPTGDPKSRNFIVKVLVENSGLMIKPGMFARVSMTIESIKDTFVFDKKALLKQGSNYYVFKVVGDRVEKISVDLKHRDKASASVLSNELGPDDRIVVEGVRFLDPNDLIKVI